VHLPNNEKALAGVMTTFGVERASDPDRSHGGSGINHAFDITELAGKLGLTAGPVSRLEVSFERIGVAPTAGGAPAGLESFVRAKRATTIKVGRVSLYYD
jgi:hypothetical protein